MANTPSPVYQPVRAGRPHARVSWASYVGFGTTAAAAPGSRPDSAAPSTGGFRDVSHAHRRAPPARPSPIPEACRGRGGTRGHPRVDSGALEARPHDRGTVGPPGLPGDGGRGLLGDGEVPVPAPSRPHPHERGEPLPLALSGAGGGVRIHARHRSGRVVPQPGQVQPARGEVRRRAGRTARRLPRGDRSHPEHLREQQRGDQRTHAGRGRRGRAVGPEPPHEQRGVGCPGRPLGLQGDPRDDAPGAEDRGRTGRRVRERLHRPDAGALGDADLEHLGGRTSGQPPVQ